MLDEISVCTVRVIVCRILHILGGEAYAADWAVDTNAIEISVDFEKYWSRFHEKHGSAVDAMQREMNVVAGPVCDSFSSAIFVIASVCETSHRLTDCPVSELDMQSFILPTHLHCNRNCIDPDDFLGSNLAALVDIEVAIGLHFFPTLFFQDRTDILS